MKIGILAYGSLIDDMGDELKEHVIDIIRGVKMPFKVEYGRISYSRSLSPTLIPYKNGGIVYGAILVLEGVSIEEAKNMLYRRETGSDEDYVDVRGKNITNNSVLIRTKQSYYNMLCIYTKIGSNIDVNVPNLVNYAIQSGRYEGDSGRDGITYLKNNINNGIYTPLTSEYVQAIIKKTRSNNLSDSLLKVRLGIDRKPYEGRLIKFILFLILLCLLRIIFLL